MYKLSLYFFNDNLLARPYPFPYGIKTLECTSLITKE